ncbi:MAG: RecX family transcriptional regulator, partial [Bdellovibrionales bacterium]|nr:RecX family transcriptional regulator [Bdellovibrionales bacterium]
HKYLQNKAKESGDRGSDGGSDDTSVFGGASSDRLINEMRQKVTRFLISRGFENNTARTVFDRLWARQKNEN